MMMSAVYAAENPQKILDHNMKTIDWDTLGKCTFRCNPDALCIPTCLFKSGCKNQEACWTGYKRYICFLTDTRYDQRSAGRYKQPDELIIRINTLGSCPVIYTPGPRAIAEIIMKKMKEEGRALTDLERNILYLTRNTPLFKNYHLMDEEFFGRVDALLKLQQ